MLKETEYPVGGAGDYGQFREYLAGFSVPVQFIPHVYSYFNYEIITGKSRKKRRDH